MALLAASLAQEKAKKATPVQQTGEDPLAIPEFLRRAANKPATSAPPAENVERLDYSSAGATRKRDRAPADPGKVYDINGKRVRVDAELKGDTLHINSISDADYGGPNSIGPSVIRKVLSELQSENPDATVVQGDRQSGARARAGTTGVVKQDIPPPALKTERRSWEGVKLSPVYAREGVKKTIEASIESWMEGKGAGLSKDRQEKGVATIRSVLSAKYAIAKKVAKALDLDNEDTHTFTNGLVETRSFKDGREFRDLVKRRHPEKADEIDTLLSEGVFDTIYYRKPKKDGASTKRK